MADKDDKATHEFDAEVFAVGTWNGDKYTKSDLDDMVRNFEAGLVRPPVKLGHNDEQPMTDGQPALGWVTKLRRVGEKLIATLSDVPDVLTKAIKAGLYKRVSSEIFWNFKQGDSIYKRVLAAVSLLGADIPAVNNLADLTAYLSQSTGDGSGSFEKVAQFEISEPHKTNLINQSTDGGNTMAENEFEKKYNDAQKAILALETKAAADAAAKDAAEAELKKFKDEQATKARAEAENDLRKFCEDQVKAFKMTPAGRDIIVKGLDEGKHVYAQATGFSIPFEVFKKFTDTFKDVVDPTEKGKSKSGGKEFDDVQTEVNARVVEYQEAHKDVAYSDAMKKVFAADPDLADRYATDRNKG